MKFIEGGSLDKYLNATPKLGMRIRLKIALEIARGMTFLHENELLHLDLKPPNFLVRITIFFLRFQLSNTSLQVVSLSQSAPVAIKLADFGLAQGSSQTFKGRKVEGSFLCICAYSSFIAFSLPTFEFIFTNDKTWHRKFS
jgi:serine/threonine protein kinase